MILIVTNRTDYTADFLILRLQKLAIPYVRFNTEDFPFYATASTHWKQDRIRLQKSESTIELSKVKSVWYRRPESPSFPDDFDIDARDFAGRESREFLLGLWRCLPCLWVNHPDSIRLAENKIEQLKRMTSMGLEIPGTVVTNDPELARQFYESNEGKVVAKTLRQSHGTLGDREYVIYTNPVFGDQLSVFQTVRYSPVIFQQRVEKASDIRVTVVGSDVFATEIHSQERDETRVDWRRDTLSLRHTVHRLPEHVEQQCLNLVRSYGLVFGALDLVKTPSSDYIFLELNPNGQWAWIESLTQQPISAKLIEVLDRGQI